MGRPREFDTQKALETAMSVFWDQGYEDASISELLTSMRITKGSFYKAFSDKHSLYLAALDLYAKNVIAPTAQTLSDPAGGPGQERILNLFRHVADAAADTGDRQGCFLCNAAVDRAAQDKDVEGRLSAMFARLENGIAAALRDMDTAGKEQMLRATARSLVALYLGFRVLGRAGRSNDYADDIITQVERILSMPPVAEPT